MTGALAAPVRPGLDRDADPVAARGTPVPPRSDSARPGGRPGGRRPGGRGRPHARALAGAHPPGAPRGAEGGRPLPDRGARDGRALGAAAQGAEEGDLHGARRGQEPPPGLLPARPDPARGRPPPGARPRTPVCLVPNGVDLAPFDDLPPRPSWRPNTPSWPASSSCCSSAGCTSRRGSTCWPTPWRRSAEIVPTLHLLLAGQRRRGARPVCGRVARRWASPTG